MTAKSARNKMHSQVTNASAVKLEMEQSSEIVVQQPIKAKRKIITDEEYKDICLFIQTYRGLAIDCERVLQVKFVYIYELTLKCIHQAQMRKCRLKYRPINSKKLLENYEKRAKEQYSSNLLVKIAKEQDLMPVRLARELLGERYNRNVSTQLLRQPYTIRDEMLAANVMQCLSSDVYDGPLMDLWRRSIGEEYEVKLKTMAESAGIHFYDEQVLRKLGYDKTPDILVYIPALYKGQLVNWIESKANFGDIKSHLDNVDKQLNSYTNRFGTGIIIYWFGYHEEVPLLAENRKDIIVLADFPANEDLVLLHFDDEAKTKWL